MESKNFRQIFPIGEKNDAYANYFIGQSYLKMLTNTGVGVANVTFEPIAEIIGIYTIREDKFYFA